MLNLVAHQLLMQQIVFFYHNTYSTQQQERGSFCPNCLDN